MDGVAVLDADGEYVYTNREHAQLYGYEHPSELEGRSWRDLYDDTEVDRFETEIMPQLEATGQWRGEAVGRRRDGGRFDQELTLSRLDDGGLVCIIRDITGRKGRERQLRFLYEATRKLMHTSDEREVARIAVDIAEKVLDHSLTACWLYDPDTDRLVPLATTEAVKRMEDTDDIDGVSELGPDSYEMAVFEEGESVLVEDYRSLSDAPPDVPLRTILMLPIGDHGVLHVGATEVREVSDAERQLLEIFVRQLEAAFDRTRRERQLEERRAELERQNERLETFASTLSHDLRNPLNVAQARTQLALEENDVEMLPAAATALDRIETLIEGVLTLARQGQTVGATDRIDLSEAVSRAARMVDGLDEVTVLGDPTVVADHERLCTLLENLFRNAVEHGGEDVTVTVGRCEDGTDGFYVADDGPGFDDDAGSAFERGYSSTETGTGFGLNIVRSIAEAHGWSVTAGESEVGGARIDVRDVEMGEP